MTHRTPDEVRRLVTEWGVTPALDAIHPQFILDDKELAHMWGLAREAYYRYLRVSDNILGHLGLMD